VRKWIIKAYKDRKVELKKYLARSASKIHFSFDLWTSPNNLALLGLVAHFVDEHGQNQSVSSPLLAYLQRIGIFIISFDVDISCPQYAKNVYGVSFESSLKGLSNAVAHRSKG
jgi:hypothetical protein